MQRQSRARVRAGPPANGAAHESRELVRSLASFQSKHSPATPKMKKWRLPLRTQRSAQKESIPPTLGLSAHCGSVPRPAAVLHAPVDSSGRQIGKVPGSGSQGTGSKAAPCSDPVGVAGAGLRLGRHLRASRRHHRVPAAGGLGVAPLRRHLHGAPAGAQRFKVLGVKQNHEEHRCRRAAAQRFRV